MTRNLNRIAMMTSTGLLMAMSTLSWANTEKPTPAQQEVIDRFKAADKNGDGKVTREEAQASMPRVAMAWEKIDVDNKGYITLDQLLLIAAANNR